MREALDPFLLAADRKRAQEKEPDRNGPGCIKTGKRGKTMKYQVQENCLTIFLPHELDHHNAEEIRKESDHLIEKNHIRYVIFDFEQTNFMDSSGIGVIMGRYKRIYMLGGEVCAVHTNERMKKILTMSGVTKIVQIYEEDK